nr:Dimethyl sulfoxide/trimethylamine N-oxide reductase precursor [Klebsiella pneumoniae]
MRVSWEQALDLIDAQHRRIRDSYGPASILPAPTAGALTAYCIRRRRCCSAI